MQSEIILTPLEPQDWPQVREIYLQGLATGQASFETEAPDWDHWNAKFHRQCRIAARQEERVLGWVALIPVSSRPCYAGVAEVSIYVGESARGKGLGDRLMAAVIWESENLGFWTLYASIFPENTGSERLLTNHGFRPVGVRERIAQHHGVWRDTLILERRSKVIGVERRAPE